MEPINDQSSILESKESKSKLLNKKEIISEPIIELSKSKEFSLLRLIRYLTSCTSVKANIKVEISGRESKDSIFEPSTEMFEINISDNINKVKVETLANIINEKINETQQAINVKIDETQQAINVKIDETQQTINEEISQEIKHKLVEIQKVHKKIEEMTNKEDEIVPSTITTTK